MRNRSNTPPKDESAFINGGSAGLNTEENKPEIKKLNQSVFLLPMRTYVQSIM